MPIDGLLTMNLLRACRTVPGLLLALLCIWPAMPASATEPLTDRYIHGANKGFIFPKECCWMPLPESARLLEAKVKGGMQCTAIGGPVGIFEQRSGKLWLTGFATCSGKLPLRDIYPELDSPALAQWLSGTFKTRIGLPCHALGGRPVFALEQELTVSEGVVTAVTERHLDWSACGQRAD
jgi:hypothetical protein